MNNLVINDIEATNKKLLKNLNAVDKYINRNYLSELSNCPVIQLSEEEKTTNSIRLYLIEKIVFDNDENTNDKLISVYSAIQSVGATLILLICGTEKETNFYIGINDTENVSVSEKTLYKSFKANFPGSKLIKENNSKITEILNEASFTDDGCNVTSVTVLPSPRDDNKEKFVQGIEKFIDTMRGESYSAILVARPLSMREIDNRKRGLEDLYSSLSPFAKTSLAYGSQESTAITEGVSENFSKSVNSSVSKTLGVNSSKSESISAGTSIGMNLGFTFGKNKGTTTGTSIGTSSSESKTQGEAETTGTGTTKSDTTTTGTNSTMTIESVNKTVDNLLQGIDAQLERIKNCESYGMWEAAAYFLSEEIQTGIVAANTFKALVAGKQTGIENSYINIWNRHNPNTTNVVEYVRYCKHPVFEITEEGDMPKLLVTAANNVSGNELPVLFGLPQKSVNGVSVTTVPEFGRNVQSEGIVSADNSRTFPLGCIHHMGTDDEGNVVNLNTDSFTSHCFITGSTGSGKSNTSYWLLHNFIRQQIPFLVIEPAKGEYKTEFGNLPDINVFTTNPNMGAMLKINPFEFSPKIHILEHLDRLIEIFNACWEMYAAMPAILKSAIEKAYTDKGWDLMNSVYVRTGIPAYPTFADVLNVLPRIISSTSYSSDSKGDYTGALVTRVQSLTNGITGQIFCDNYSVEDSVLFDENTIVDLSRIGSNETKSLIMGILVMKLSEYRTATAIGSNSNLRHITVLEEAHNLLKNVSKDQSQQSANLVGKSVEMICNSIAEMRTYGEGFVIIDQSPSSVDIAAIKNTNTKIAMRLPEKGDCEAIGKSLGLDDDQIAELSKLPVGVGAVLQNNWLEAVLCHVNKADGKYRGENPTNTFEQIKMLRSAALEAVMVQFSNNKSLDYESLKDAVISIDISASAKQEMLNRLKFIADSLAKQTDDYEKNVFCYESVLHLSGMLGVFASCEEFIFGKESDTGTATLWKQQIILQMERLFVFKNVNVYEFLFKRLLLVMRWHSTNISYAEIFRTLYGRE